MLAGSGREVRTLGERLSDILNGKLKFVQNRKATDTETEDDDDEDDEDVPEEIGTPKTYDTRWKMQYIPIRTNPERDALQIHTDGEIPGESLENIVRRSNRNSKKPNRYGTVPYTGNFWV